MPPAHMIYAQRKSAAAFAYMQSDFGPFSYTIDSKKTIEIEEDHNHRTYPSGDTELGLNDTKCQIKYLKIEQTN